VVKRPTALSFSSMLQKPRSNIIFSKIVWGTQDLTVFQSSFSMFSFWSSLKFSQL
jgi:hypothetical protein